MNFISLGRDDFFEFHGAKMLWRYFLLIWSFYAGSSNIFEGGGYSYSLAVFIHYLGF